MPNVSTPSRARTPRGISLLEAVAAVVIVGIVAPSLLVAVRDAALQRASLQQQIVARWLICEKLEDVIADRHGRGWSSVVETNYPSEPTVAGFSGFSRSTSIAETSADLATPGTGYRRVTVTVSYADAKKGAESFTISVILTPYDQ